ncbi:PREDICTED: uncharacterized protein LOC109356642 isoform X1 [Lupinus angustifolius]|uniref:uncharacterized protein LOC109356642 isoform X1 n=1 Tax=Lupinus angustifolius TaxID=3871 RepID=UPI00092EC0A3|nr:PREDICTED: uncharacterized protein LOC109356642 isoform X1 [Lupinus angustifolius]XP_019455611.1 PREDICTED: uncharacterized protein LOC109356642 isoform X1 [Lupinus angustifolius]
MPFFEIANAQFSLQYNLCSLKVQTPYHGKLSSVSFAFCNEHSAACAWKSLGRFRPLIKAIATILEPNNLVAMEDKCLGSKDLDLGLSPNPREVLLESSVEESEEPDEKERLRRMKISKANKGQAAWNKGRKHSPETLRKIKERTRLAMQNPKIKMKLANIRHPQTIETRLKIAAGVKMRCKRRRERKVVQETCCFKWQNLIAETSRRGYAGQEELQWNSFEILNEQLELEWLASVKECKTMPREPGSNRAPKTLEHRRKIAAAISAKWADPEYVNKVYSAKGKHHDTERAERKPRRRPIDGAQSIRKNPIVKMNANLNVKSDTKFLNYVRLKKSMSSPSFKDPLVSSKLEMLKTIRVQRSAADTELTKTIQQARLLIAEAEKAAQALEFATTKSHIAQTSLIETRQLIAEAIQSLESIDAQGIVVSNIPSSSSSEVKKENDADFEALNQSHKDPVNGHETLSSSDYKFYKDLGKVSLQKFVDGDSEQLHPTSINGFVSIPVGFNCKIEQSSSSNQQCQTEHEHSSKYKIHTSSTVLGIQSIKDEKQPISPTVTKKWVCGRLVEVVKQ